MKNLRILIIEDNKEHADALVEACGLAETRVVHNMHDAVEALDIAYLTRSLYHQILLDVKLEDGSTPQQVIDKVYEMSSGAPIIVVSRFLDAETLSMVKSHPNMLALPKDGIGTSAFTDSVRQAITRMQKHVAKIVMLAAETTDQLEAITGEPRDVLMAKANAIVFVWSFAFVFILSLMAALVEFYRLLTLADKYTVAPFFYILVGGGFLTALAILKVLPVIIKYLPKIKG